MSSSFESSDTSLITERIPLSFSRLLSVRNFLLSWLLPVKVGRFYSSSFVDDILRTSVSSSKLSVSRVRVKKNNLTDAERKTANQDVLDKSSDGKFSYGSVIQVAAKYNVY